MPQIGSFSKVVFRFWAKVEVGWPDECWTWLAGTNDKGYGKFGWSNSHWLAHRFSWRVSQGQIPDGLCVLHHCDNSFCVNPDHLWLGTRADNNADMMRKGRYNKRPKPGSRCGRAKLTERDVLKIRQRYAKGETYVSIAEDYPVTFSAIARAVKRKGWRHI